MSIGGSARENAGAIAMAAIAGLLPFAILPALNDPRTSQRFAMQIAVCIAGAIAAAVSLRRRRAALALAPSELAALGFGAWTMLSSALSNTPRASMLEAMATATAIAAFLLFRRCVARETGFRIVASGFVLAAAAVAAAGLAQRFGHDVLDYRATEREGKLRILSLLGNPNYVASFLAPAAFATGALAFSLRRAATRCAAGIAIVPIVGCLAISGGKAGILGFAVGAACLAALCGIRAARSRGVGRRTIVGGAVALAAVGAMGAGVAWRSADGELRERVLSSDSIHVRLLPWHVASGMVSANPVLGIGAGRFYAEGREAFFRFLKGRPDAELYLFEMRVSKGGAPDHLHNEYLQILVECGIPGVLLFFATVCLAAGPCLRRAVADGGTGAAFLIAALAAHLADAAFGFPFRLPASSLLFWFVLAACAGESREGELRIPGGAARTAIGIAACAAMVAATTLSFRQAEGVRLRVRVARASSLLNGDPMLQRRFEEAWLLAPFVEPSPHALVNMHIDRGNRDRALALLAKMEDYLYMGGVGYRQMAAEAWALDRADEAARCLDRATALDPFDGEATEYAAAVSLEQGRADDAEALLRATTRRDPVRPNAYWMLGAISEARGDRREAADRYERALRAANGYGGTLLFKRADAEKRLTAMRAK